MSSEVKEPSIDIVEELIKLKEELIKLKEEFKMKSEATPTPVNNVSLEEDTKCIITYIPKNNKIKNNGCCCSIC